MDKCHWEFLLWYRHICPIIHDVVEFKSICLQFSVLNLSQMLIRFLFFLQPVSLPMCRWFAIFRSQFLSFSKNFFESQVDKCNHCSRHAWPGRRKTPFDLILGSDSQLNYGRRDFIFGSNKFGTKLLGVITIVYYLYRSLWQEKHIFYITPAINLTDDIISTKNPVTLLK